MELLRTMNSKLRDNADIGNHQYEEMQYKLDEMREWKKIYKYCKSRHLITITFIKRN